MAEERKMIEGAAQAAHLARTAAARFHDALAGNDTAQMLAWDLEGASNRLLALVELHENPNRGLYGAPTEHEIEAARGQLLAAAVMLNLGMWDVIELPGHGKPNLHVCCPECSRVIELESAGCLTHALAREISPKLLELGRDLEGKA